MFHSACSGTISTCGLQCVVMSVSIETLICVLCESNVPSPADKSAHFIRIKLCVCVCLCVCMYVCVCMCACVRACVCIN